MCRSISINLGEKSMNLEWRNFQMEEDPFAGNSFKMSKTLNSAYGSRQPTANLSTHRLLSGRKEEKQI